MLHEDGSIVIRTIDSKTYRCSFYEYRDTVLAFANEVERFFSDSLDRIVPDEEPEKSGFQAFKNEWLHLKDEVRSATTNCCKNNSIDYSDYKSITEKDILNINSNGISYRGGFINFRECSYNFESEHGGDGKCVGERDLTGSSPSFTFYTALVTTHIFFIPKGKLSEIFSIRPTHQRFYALQEELNLYGYTTLDLS